MQSEIMVSVICLTYNHEDYIADAIESFLMQKTNFNFEILIHDDASTDGTTAIIKEYEKKYAEIIKPVYQIENQYSKGLKVYPIIRGRAKGKYIIICEGDDFWTDCHKLQKQVDYMESNSDCSMCAHAAYMVSPKREKLQSHIRPNIGDKTFKVEEVIAGGGGLFATNSMLYRAKFDKKRPVFYENAPVGDYPLAVYLALQGKVYYMDVFMSAYRANVSGSWTSRTFSSIEKIVELNNRLAIMFDEINIYTSYKYDTIIKNIKIHRQFRILLAQGKIKELKKSEFRQLYSALEYKIKIKLYFNNYLPKTSNLLRNIKRKYARWAMK